MRQLPKISWDVTKKQLWVWLALGWALMGHAAQPVPVQPCQIQIVEERTGWPVPLVELRTTHHARFVSDNAGNIAFDLPELIGRETWFNVKADGYEVKPDGFGMRGVRLKPEPGKLIKVELKRTSIARRLGRLTGAGQFAESQKLGLPGDWQESGIVGQDSVQNAVHRGRLFWFWGDTTLARYPLGIFDGTGATTDLQPLIILLRQLKAVTYFKLRRRSERVRLGSRRRRVPEFC